MSSWNISRRAALSTALGGIAAAAVPTSRAFAKGANFTSAGLAKIPAAMQAYIDDGSEVGIVTMLYRRGEIAQINTLGFQDKEAGKKMQRDTIFRIASMTKVVNVVAAMTLLEQGKFALTDPIDKWIPELANPMVLDDPTGPLDKVHAAPRPISVLDLMTHRSGLVYDFTSVGPIAEAMKPRGPIGGLSADAWLARLKEVPLAHDPGARWHYGVSSDVLGALIARVSGKSLDAYVHAAVLDPLAMKDSGFSAPAEKQARIARVYAPADEKGVRAPVDLVVPETAPAFPSGGGGMVSTVDDYCRFARMLLGKGKLGGVRILSERSVGLMTSDYLTDAQRTQMPRPFTPGFFVGRGFGLNLSIVEDPAALAPGTARGSVGAYGWPGAYGTWWQGDPKADMIALYMVQDLPGFRARTPAAQPATPKIPGSTVFNNLAYEALA